MTDRLAILIGNGRFEADASLHELFGPRHDVASLGRLLGDPDIGNYTVFEVLDRDSVQLAEEVEALFAMAAPGANLLLYYAGWVLTEPGRGLYLATADTRLDAINETALPVSTLKAMLRRCSATEMTVLFDCCYGSPAGAVDEHAIEHDLRRVRTDVSPDLHLIASPARTCAPDDRETATDSGLEGAMTRCIVEGIATGAADRDGDNATSATELNEYLGLRLGDDRPLWAGPLGGVDPEIVVSPNPIDGLAIDSGEAEVELWIAARRALRGVVGLVAAALLLLGLSWWWRTGSERQVVRLDQVYEGTALPESVGRFDDLDALRAVVDRTGWVEHVEPFDGRGPRYPSAVSFRLDPGNRAPPGTVELHLRQWAQMEFGAGVQGFGIDCAEGLNIAEVLVELTGGERYVFEVRSATVGACFFGFIARAPLHRLRVTSTSARFAAERLYVYAVDEHPRAPARQR